MQKRNSWIIAIAILLIIVGIFLVRRKEAVAPVTDDMSTSTTSIDISKISNATTSITGPGYTLEKIDDKADSAEYNRLLALGLSLKASGNYAGAAQAWLAAAKLAPNDFLVYNNLGDLFAYYLHDNAKAEVYFATSIKNDSRQISVYRSFYEFYRLVLKDDTKAKAILQAGITANPETSADLKYLLDNYASAQ